MGGLSLLDDSPLRLFAIPAKPIRTLDKRVKRVNKYVTNDSDLGIIPRCPSENSSCERVAG